jgi:hypothetical protein
MRVDLSKKQIMAILSSLDSEACEYGELEPDCESAYQVLNDAFGRELDQNCSIYGCKCYETRCLSCGRLLNTADFTAPAVYFDRF